MKQIFWVNFALAIFTGFLSLILAVVAVMYAIYLDSDLTTQGEFNALLGYLFFFCMISGLHFLAWPGLKRKKLWVCVPLVLVLGLYIWGLNFLVGLG